MDIFKDSRVSDTLNQALDTALIPLRPFVSKSAQKAYLSTALFAITSTLLLGVASIAFWLFYYEFVPQPGVERVAHLQFRKNDDPHGLVTHDPHGLMTFPSALIPNQAYDISLHLNLPRTPTNLRVGNFMLSLALLSSSTTSVHALLSATTPPVTNDTVAHSRRPATLTYTSPLTDTASTLTWLPMYVFGLSQESETLVVPMFEGVEFPKGKEQVPQAASVALESEEKMQVYGMKMVIIAKLSGLRWVLYNHRILSFAVFASAFWSVSMLSMGIVWLFLNFYLESEGYGGVGKGKGKGKGEEKRGIKMEEESTPESENARVGLGEQLSDTSRTFPTLGRQKPLKYEGGGAGIKKEQEEGLLEQVGQPLQAMAAEADDEDDFEDAASSAWRDSGIGTGVEERSRVQRRRSGRKDG